MADEKDSYDLGDDSSLEKFEEELVHEEKKKARSNFLLGILVLLIIGAIGFYGYTSIYAPKTPPPRKQAVKAVTPPPAPAPPAAEPVAPDAPAAPMMEIKEEPLVVEIKVEEPVETKQTEAAAMTPEAKAETFAPEMTASVSDGKIYTLQVGFFRVPENAERIGKRLSDLNLRPTLTRRNFSVRKIRVYTGEYLYRETAEKGALMLDNQGFIPKVALTGPGRYELEMGSFDTEEQADGLVRQIEDRKLNVRLDTGVVKMDATEVRLENIDGTQRLEEIMEILERENIDFFLVRH